MESTKENRKYYILSLVMLMIMVGFRCLPCPGSMTPLGMSVLGIMLGAIFGWCTIGMIWPSFVAVFLLILTNVDTGANIIKYFVSNDTVLLVFSMLLFGGIMNSTGVAYVIARKLINLKCNNGRPWMLTFFILVASMVVSAIITPIPTILLVWDIVYALSDVVGYKKGDKWVTAMLYNVAFSATWGLMIFPFSTAVIGVIGVVNFYNPTFSVPFGPYLLFSVLFCFLMLFVMLATMRFVMKPDVTNLKNYQVSTEGTSLNSDQKLALSLLMVLIVFLLLPGILPSSWTFTQQLMNLTNPGIIIVIISAGLILRKKDGKHYIHFPEIARTGISWEMIIMLAAAYTIGSYLATEQTGFNSTLITFVQPMFEGKGSFFFYVVVLVITLLLTNILDNAVVGFAITPIAYNIAIAIGANPVLAVVIVVYFCELGFLFPASSASGALIHSNDKWISKKYVFSYAFIAITQSILAGIAFFLPLGLLIF